MVDPRSGTAAAELEFVTTDKSYQSLVPPVGTVGQISFEIISGQVILIPENALSYVNGKPNVRVLSGLKTQRREIILGEQRESFFAIKSGLTSGEKIIIRSNRAVKDNEEVEVQTPEAKEAK